MSESGEKASWRRSPRWMKLLLVVSLLGNAAVVGTIGGAILHHQFERRDHGLNRQQAWILRLVPKDQRASARSILMQQQDQSRAARVDIQKAQQQILAALRAKPFSHDQLAAALTARQDASAKFWGIGSEQFLQIVTSLSPADRAIMADRMDQALKRWADRRGHD